MQVWFRIGSEIGQTTGIQLKSVELHGQANSFPFESKTRII
jgi:hypothetical protein